MLIARADAVPRISPEATAVPRFPRMNQSIRLEQSAPARGILTAMLMGSCIWLVTALALWMILTH